MVPAVLKVPSRPVGKPRGQRCVCEAGGRARAAHGLLTPQGLRGSTLRNPKIIGAPGGSVG